MPRLPQVGGDASSWGDILNDYLSQSLAADGSIKSDAVSADQIADGSITTAQLASSVQTSLSNADTALQDIADGSITTVKLTDGSVTTPKLADGAATTIKLADASVTSTKLADSSVTTTKITDTSVTTAKIANSSITEAKLDSGIQAKINAIRLVPSPTGIAATDTANIQNTINSSISGETILFQPGTYRVSSAITLKSDRWYQGTHFRQVTIQQEAGATTMAAIFVNEEWVNNQTFGGIFQISDMTIDGNKSNNVGATTTGVLAYAYQSNVRRLRVNEMTGDGIRFTDRAMDNTTVPSGTLNENRVSDCFIRQCNGSGIVVDDFGPNKLTDGYCTDNIINSCSQHGMHIKRAAGWLISGNHSYTGVGFGFSGIWAVNCFSTRIVNNYIDNYGESATTGFYAGIRADLSTIRGSVVSGNTVSQSRPVAGTTYRQIHVNCGTSVTAARAVVSDNIIVGNGASGEQGIRLEAGTGSILTVEMSTNKIDSCTTRFVTGGGGTISYTPEKLFGTGTPEGSVSAFVGATYHRLDGAAATTLYIKETGTGNTGWVAK